MLPGDKKQLSSVPVLACCADMAKYIDLCSSSDDEAGPETSIMRPHNTGTMPKPGRPKLPQSSASQNVPAKVLAKTSKGATMPNKSQGGREGSLLAGAGLDFLRR